MKNIGHAFIMMGQYADAASSYERLLDSTPIRVCFCVLLLLLLNGKEVGGQEVRVPGKDFKAAFVFWCICSLIFSFNLMLCYYALGDRDKMRRTFLRLLSLRLDAGAEDERYLNVHVRFESRFLWYNFAG
jgi:hypothetical protein